MNKIHDTEASKLDLNLLRVFVAIWQERHLGAAAERLHLTPSAVSHSLQRLRQQWQDELFIRSGRRLRPTARAEQLGPLLQAQLDQLQQLLNPKSEFIPADSQRTFVFSLRELLEPTALPGLVQTLHGHAPASHLHSVRLARSDTAEALRQGRVDFALDVKLDMPDVIRSQRLMHGPLSVIMREGHPLAENLSLDDYLAAQHVQVSGRPSGAGIEDRALAQQGLPARNIVLRCQSYLAACHHVAGSDSILTMPSIATWQAAQTLKLAQCPLPFEGPNFEVYLYWHLRADSDPALLWMREQVQALFDQESSKPHS